MKPNKLYDELDNWDFEQIRSFALDRMREVNEVNGSEIWMYAALLFLESRGYDIVPRKDDPSSSDGT